jgi:PLP dependent protein
MSQIRNNIQQILGQLPSHVNLVAVSKFKPIESLLEAYDGGFKAFGENYVQELVEKYEKLPKDIEWHFIGHLQSNKVKYIAPFVSLIHSVDSLKLLKEINKQAEKNQRVIDVLLQIFIAEEDTKTGMDIKEFQEMVASNAFEGLEFVNVVGLMGMSTFTEDSQQIGKEFSKLADLFSKFQKVVYPNFNLKILSMGMSGDWQLAIEKGSTLIRVGSAIFGNR